MAAISRAGSDDSTNLVLRIAVGERVVIEDRRIVITCVKSGDDGCKLAFEAARGIPIDREKVYESKKRDHE
jgi:sRNA-binding carbon storage regulator CsrA